MDKYLPSTHIHIRASICYANIRSLFNIYGYPLVPAGIYKRKN